MSEYQAHIQTGLLANANEAPDNLDQAILDELAALVYQTAFNRYPDDSASELKEAAALVYGVNTDQILCGSGSDQMLDVVIAAFVRPDRPLVTIQPDFSMYDFYCHKLGCPVEKLAVGFARMPDLDALAQKAHDVNAGLVMFSNPNNPLGFVLKPEQIKALADALDPIVLCVDEAYVEFAGCSALPLIDSCGNLMVTRTLSKAYSLAGLRCGFLISNPSLIAKAEAVRTVYNLPSFTMKAAAAVLGHSDEFIRKAQDLAEKRDRLIDQYNSLEGIEAAPSGANFICLKSDHIEDIQNACENEGIALRFYGPESGYFRVTVLNNDDDARILECIAKGVQA